MRQGGQELLQTDELTSVNLSKRLDQFVFILSVEGEALVRTTRQDRDSASLGKRNALDYDTTFNDGSGDELHGMILARGALGWRALTPNVRAKREQTAGRQALAMENVRCTRGQGLEACRWRSA
jgi:hypothetical protein